MMEELAKFIVRNYYDFYPKSTTVKTDIINKLLYGKEFNEILEILKKKTKMTKYFVIYYLVEDALDFITDNLILDNQRLGIDLYEHLLKKYA